MLPNHIFLQKILILVSLISSVLLANTSCSTIPLRARADSLFQILDNVSTYYDLDNPDKKVFIPYALSEISGLTLLPDGTFMCIEDESGKVYRLDIDSATIISATTFSRPKDFEDLEIVNDTMYVLESDGDIYEFAINETEKPDVKRYETPLRRKNDTEGLGYNPYTNRLLIACKGDEDIKGHKAKGKAIYEFDLKTKKLIKEPAFEITSGDMKDFFEANRDFEYEKDRIQFKPSGIAYNPLDGFFYLLASVGKWLIVFDKKGKIQATYTIPPKVLLQPEGICFDPSGVLFISSEGQGEKGQILKFTPKKK